MIRELVVSMKMWSHKLTVSAAQALEYVKPLRTLATSVKAKINFNSKHLKKGDALPPYNGTLRIYNMRFCPFAQRTILALNAKEIDYEVVNIALMDRPDWIYEKSAFGKVPALEIKKNVTIYESLVTVEYLDEVYPNRPLLPKDPVKKAHDKMVVEASGGIHNLFFKLVKRPESINEENINAFRRSLDIIQEQLQKRNAKFLYGNMPGYVDYMIWPWFERLVAFEGVDDRAKINPNKYNSLLKYINNMMEDPAVSQYLIPKELFQQFHDGFKNEFGPNYELLTENT